MGNGAKIGLVGVLTLIVLIVALWDRTNEEKHQDGLKNLPVTPLDKDRQDAGRVRVARDAAPQDHIEGTITHGLTTVAAGMNPAGKTPPVAGAGMHGATTVQGSMAAGSGTGTGTTVVEGAATGHSAPPRKMHTVKTLDTLSLIALEVYGNKKYWRKIYDANKDVIRDPDHLPVGKDIVIPALETAQAPGATTVRPSLSHTTEVGAVPASATNGGARMYTVVHGDTLSIIAQKTLGSKTKWPLIFEANRDKLPTENSLKDGQQLVIPASR